MADETESQPSGRPSDDGAANDMHVHKPKAPHSLREFLSEIAIIVLGIVIALGLEQTVEWLHTRSDVAETREALKGEIALNATLAQYSAAEDRCLAKNAQNVIAWAKGGPRPPLLYPHRFELQSTVWDLSKSGAINHMPLKERSALADYYDQVAVFNKNRDAQRQVSIRNIELMLLDTLTKEQAQRLVESMLGAGVLDRYQSVNADEVLKVSRSMGVTPAPMSADKSRELVDFCRAVGGPIPEGLAPG